MENINQQIIEKKEKNQIHLKMQIILDYLKKLLELIIYIIQYKIN